MRGFDGLSFQQQLMAGAAIVAVASASPAQAQVRSFDVPAQPAAQGIPAFAKQARVQIIASGNVVQGRRTNAVRGSYPIDEGLRRLLDGTGLVAESAGTTGIITIRSANPGNGPAAVAAAAANNAQSNSPAARLAGREAGAATGVIVDGRTGARLKGARVEIEGTGIATATDDLGAFRIPALRPGQYTLRISYLGYPDTVVSIEVGAGVAQPATIALSTTPEIVVHGQRSARAKALNQERTAQNFTTVVSDDLLGRFEGATVSEAIRRSPGVAFIEDPTTGEGTNVIVRGLAPDFNTITLNGLRIPEGSGEGRSPSLNNILADSISKITINKTLLPSQDGSGTGGLVEIETKGPLDRPDNYLSASVQYGKRAKSFNDDLQVSTIGSKTFPVADGLGVSLSLQYRRNKVDNISYTASHNFGQYLPLDPDGNPYLSFFEIDPRSYSFPFDKGVDDIYPQLTSISYNEAISKTFSAGLSTQLLTGDTQLTFNYLFSRNRRNEFNRNSLFLAFTGYTLLPVEPGGEERAHLIWEDAFGPGSGLAVAKSDAYSTQISSNISHFFDFSGKTQLGRLGLDYLLGHSRAKRTVPEGTFLSSGYQGFIAFFDRSLLLPEALSNTAGGLVVSAYSPYEGRALPLPLLTPQGFDEFNSSENNFINQANRSARFGSNDRYTAKLDAKLDVNRWFIRNLAAGAFYERSMFRSRSFTAASFSGNVSAAELGMQLSPDNDLSRIGFDNSFQVFSQDAINSFWNQVGADSTTLPLTFRFGTGANDPRRKAFTREEELALYLQSEAKIGDFEVIGGVRYENIETKARVPVRPVIIRPDGTRDMALEASLEQLSDETGRQIDFMPRMLINWRPSEYLVGRFGYYRTIARPQITNLSRQKVITLDLRPIHGPGGNQPILRIGQGNPDLKPAYTDHFDLALERYFTDVGSVKASVFYKRIKNLLQSNIIEGFDVLDGVVLPDADIFRNLPADIFVSGTKPVNSSDTARIWGLELSFEKRFSFLPGILSNTGIFANYTYTRSKRREVQTFFTLDGAVPYVVSTAFSGDPKHSGTVAWTYSSDTVDASLAYTRQDRRLDFFQPYGLTSFDEADSSLDLKAQYNLNIGQSVARIFLEGTDLLKSTRDPDVEKSVGGVGSTPKVFTSGTYLGGRRISLGVTLTL